MAETSTVLRSLCVPPGAFLWCAQRFVGLGALLVVVACYQPSEPANDETGGPPHVAEGHHEACTEALRGDVPEGPKAGSSSVTAPDCSTNELEVVECGPGAVCPWAGQCLATELGGPGVCAGIVACPAGEPVVHGNGSCLSCVSAQLKHALCCNGVSGFDCRGYPGVPARASKPGELCHEHADCEPGLWCAPNPTLPESQGRCTCPGIDASDVFEPPECSPASAPAAWQPVVHPLEHCEPALAKEFSVEPFPGGLFGDAVAAPDGSLHVFSLVQHDVLHFFKLSGQGWQSEPIAGLRADSLSAVADAESHLHVLAICGDEGTVVYANDASGSWALDALTSNTYPLRANIVLGASGAPEFSYTNIKRNVVWGTYSEAGYRERTVADGWTNSSDLLLIGGELTWLFSDERVFSAVFRDNEFQLSALFHGENLNAALTSLGELFIAYTPEEYSGEVRVAHVRGAAIEHSSVWSQDDPRIVNDEILGPTLALDKQDRPSVAFVTPHDVSLARWQNDAWIITPLVSDVPEGFRAKLVIDAEQKSHVFYAGGTLNSVRHVFEGACSDENPK